MGAAAWRIGYTCCCRAAKEEEEEAVETGEMMGVGGRCGLAVI